VNAVYSKTFLLCSRPLSVSGLSQHSTGHRLCLSGRREHQREAQSLAFAHVAVHPTMVASNNLQLFIGNEMLMIKDLVFPNKSPAFDYRGLIFTALQAPNVTPERKEQDLGDILEVASRNGIRIDEPCASADSTSGPAGTRGISPAGDDGVLIDIDGAMIGLTNVAEAVRLVDALSPPVSAPTFVHKESEWIETLPAEISAPLRINFSHPGNGGLFLRQGWGDNESWGTWTTSDRAEIRMGFEQLPDRLMKIGIEGQMFVHPDKEDAGGAVRLNGGRSFRFNARREAPRVKIEFVTLPEELAHDQAIVLEFEIDCPVSPAELGLSSDTRCLGFGLRQITVESTV